MLLLEALAAVILICGMSAGAAFVVTRILRFLDARTLDGKIAKKRAELAEQDRYIRRISGEASMGVRGELQMNYLKLADRKREQLQTELNALTLEKERRDFEEHMKGSK